MLRFLTILAAALISVGCAHKRPFGSTGSAENKFSWEKESASDAPAGPASAVPEDSATALVVAVIEEQGLIELARSGDKPEVKSRLRLDKFGKLVDVEVLRHTDSTILVGIVPNQENHALVYAGDIVSCGVIPAKQ